MWILGCVALLDGLRSSTGIFPCALSPSWACAQTTRVDLSPGPSPTLGPGASLPLKSLSWPQPPSGMLVVQWYISRSGQPRGPERPAAGSLMSLTWGQMQLVERLELLCEVSMVHPTCGARPGRGHAWQEGSRDTLQAISPYPSCGF